MGSPPPAANTPMTPLPRSAWAAPSAPLGTVCAIALKPAAKAAKAVIAKVLNIEVNAGPLGQ
jgi:hypothetical protein